MDDNKSFWTTIPGILSAIAGLLVAITGLITALCQFEVINCGTQGYGSIVVDSRPRGAKVFVDANLKGTTTDGELTVTDLEEGSHKLLLTKEKYKSWEETVSLAADERLFILAEMKKEDEKPSTQPTPSSQPSVLPTPKIPTLVRPAPGVLMDNGCTGGRDEIKWAFTWSPLPGATKYHLYVIGRTATNPVVDLDNLLAPSHIHTRTAHITSTHTRGWRWKVRAFVDGAWQPWSAERTFDVEKENTDCPEKEDTKPSEQAGEVSPPGVPSLVRPAPGVLMDNGCTGGREEIKWTFTWSPLLGATKYHLYVIGRTATNPVVDLNNLSATTFMHTRKAYITSIHTHGWRWKVRAYVGGAWQAWSAERTFDVERENTDCP